MEINYWEIEKRIQPVVNLGKLENAMNFKFEFLKIWTSICFVDFNFESW